MLNIRNPMCSCRDINKIKNGYSTLFIFKKILAPRIFPGAKQAMACLKALIKSFQTSHRLSKSDVSFQFYRNEGAILAPK